jgi:two-component system, sensor histidine kinase and response regulator
MERDDASFILNVTDHGRGMTPEQIASIGAYMQFERKLYEQQGTGLGLVIAKRLTELHGGQMTITSVPGEHTTVRAMLPVANIVS